MTAKRKPARTKKNGRRNAHPRCSDGQPPAAPIKVKSPQASAAKGHGDSTPEGKPARPQAKKNGERDARPQRGDDRPTAASAKAASAAKGSSKDFEASLKKGSFKGEVGCKNSTSANSSQANQRQRWSDEIRRALEERKAIELKNASPSYPLRPLPTASASDLLLEIHTKEMMLGTLPPPSDSCTVLSAECQEWAKLKKEVGTHQSDLAILLEQDRIDAVVCDHEKAHPPMLAQCPVCLDSIKVVANSSMRYVDCCGNGVCNGCYQDAFLEGKMLRCPLCREPLIKSERANKATTLKHAKRGVPWAQTNAGMLYSSGTEGFELNQKEAFKWMKRAAAQQFPDAMFKLAHMHFQGIPGIVKRDDAKAEMILEDAANRGSPLGQQCLSSTLFHGESAFFDSEEVEKKEAKAVHYATLAVSHLGHKSSSAAHVLGTCFARGEGGLETNVHLAKYYFEIAAMNDFAHAYDHLARITLRECEELYGQITLAGYSPIPRAMYLAKKAVTASLPNGNLGAEMVEQLQTLGQRACAYCRTAAGGKGEGCPMKNCSKCRSVWYCSRDCQVAHWKAGHKVDCVKHDAQLEDVFA